MKTFHAIALAAVAVAAVSAIKIAEGEEPAGEAAPLPLPIAACDDFYYRVVKDIYNKFAHPFFTAAPAIVDDVIESHIHDEEATDPVGDILDHLAVAGEISYVLMAHVIDEAFIDASRGAVKDLKQLADKPRKVESDFCAREAQAELDDRTEEELGDIAEANGFDLDDLEEYLEELKDEYKDHIDEKATEEEYLGTDYGTEAVDDYCHDSDLELPHEVVTELIASLGGVIMEFNERTHESMGAVMHDTGVFIHDSLVDASETATEYSDDLKAELLAAYEGYLHSKSDEFYFALEQGAIDFCSGVVETLHDVLGDDDQIFESYEIIEEYQSDLDDEIIEAKKAHGDEDDEESF